MLPENSSSNPQTEGGALVGGSIDAGGDFIGRAQNVQGDIVKGNKIVVHTTASSPTPSEQLLPPPSRWRRASTINTILIGIFTFFCSDSD